MRIGRTAVLIMAVICFLAPSREARPGGRDDWTSANLMAEQGELEKAEDLFRRILDNKELSDSDRAKVHASRGVVRRKRGDLDGALEDFQQALALDRNLKEAYLNRGNLWRLKGQPYRALADYSKALELDPKWAPPYHGIAWLMATSPDEKVRNGVTALDMAQKAVSLERNANHLDTLAAALARNGRFREAVEAEQEALAQLKNGNRQERKAAFEKRLEAYRAGRPWQE